MRDGAGQLGGGRSGVKADQRTGVLVRREQGSSGRVEVIGRDDHAATEPREVWGVQQRAALVRRVVRSQVVPTGLGGNAGVCKQRRDGDGVTAGRQDPGRFLFVDQVLVSEVICPASDEVGIGTFDVRVQRMGELVSLTPGVQR